MRKFVMTWRLWAMLALMVGWDIFRIILHATDTAHIVWYGYLPFTTLAWLPLVLYFARQRGKLHETVVQT